MPARGAESNLTDDEIRHVAAYVWGISQTRGEPWPGGHQSHPEVEAHDSKQGEGKAQEHGAMKSGGHGGAATAVVGEVSPGCPEGSAPAAKGGHSGPK